ncbi:MAG: hypothetical protein AAF962_08105 [Actinomycetota bacterium]
MLGLALPTVFVVTLLIAIVRDVPTDIRIMSVFLGSAGPAAAATVGLLAGLGLLRRPVSSITSGGIAVVGGVAVLLGLLTVLSAVDVDFGFEAIFDRTVTNIIGPPGTLVIVGAAAVVVGLTARNAGDAVPTVAVLGLLGASLVVGLNGIAREVLGVTFSSDLLGRAATVLSTFSLESALLVLAAAVLLVLHVGRNAIWPAVAGAAGWILVATGLTSLLALASDDGPVAQLAQDPSRTSAAVAIAAIALALAVLSASPTSTARR